MLYSLFQWFVKLTGLIPQLIVFRMKVYYEDKAVQGRRIRSKAIVVSNHRYLLDFAVLMFTFWPRTLRCAVAEIMYQKNFFMTTLLNLLGCVQVQRDSCDFSFMDSLKRILDKGGVVEIFPEARLPEAGQTHVREFKPSYVKLALESGAPIIPVYSNGELFSSKRVRVVVGKPIDALALYDNTLSEKENIQKINIYVRSKIIELAEQISDPGETQEKETVGL